MRLRRRQAPPAIETGHIPAPLGGVNSVAGGSAMPPGDCVYAYNVIPGENGLRARSGSREWCTGLAGGADSTVRTTMGFRGSAKNGSKDKLFACTSTGIWDVSNSSASPAQVLAFASSANNAGYGVFHTVVTSAGHFLLYTDEENGYHVYTESTDTWATPTEGVGVGQIAGIDPATFRFVTVFKNRVVFAAADSQTMYYLAAGAIYGTATAFPLAGQFRHGGDLRGLWSFTYDGGAGMDDSLVAISSGGDVVIYQGSDVSSANSFGLKGIWHAGEIPAGRRIATQYGGDLLILSALGVIPLSRLVVGAGEDLNQYATAKIANRFNALTTTHRGNQGWGFVVHPADNALLVLVPSNGPAAATTQQAMSFATRGWFPYRELPICSADTWNGDMYFGTDDGRVMRATGYVDEVSLADSNEYEPVEYSLLSRYENLGNARQKRVAMIRPHFSSQTAQPVFEATAKFDFDILEPAAPTADAETTSETWDEAEWDEAVWGAESTPSNEAVGATGCGRNIAVAIRGRSIGLTVLVGIDVYFTQGGVL